MLIFSVVIFVFSTLTLSPPSPLPRKVGVMTPQLLWERRPCVRWPEVWRFHRSLTVLHFRTGGSEWCTECQGRHSSR